MSGTLLVEVAVGWLAAAGALALLLGCLFHGAAAGEQRPQRRS